MRLSRSHSGQLVLDCRRHFDLVVADKVVEDELRHEAGAQRVPVNAVPARRTQIKTRTTNAQTYCYGIEQSNSVVWMVGSKISVHSGTEKVTQTRQQTMAKSG